MAFPNITEFKERMKDGGARPSLFQMQISWPAALVAVISGADALAPFHIHTSEIPGESLTNIALKYAGRDVHFAGISRYEPLTITVMNDNGFTVRKALEQWKNNINSREGNIARLTNPTGVGGYTGTGRVTQFNLEGQPARSYVFIDMYPENIGAIPLAWANDAQIAEYQVTFRYQYWMPSEDYLASAVGGFLPSFR